MATLDFKDNLKRKKKKNLLHHVFIGSIKMVFLDPLG